MESEKHAEVNHTEAVSIPEDKLKDDNNNGLDQPFTQEEESRVLWKLARPKLSPADSHCQS